MCVADQVDDWDRQKSRAKLCWFETFIGINKETGPISTPAGVTFVLFC